MHVQVRVGAEHYAIASDCVLEVAEFGDVTAVPGAPGAVIGVGNFRGQIMPVVALAACLQVPSSEHGGVILVTRYEHTLVGLAASSVLGVDELPPAGELVHSPHLSGAALVKGALVGVVDVASVLRSVFGEAVSA